MTLSYVNWLEGWREGKLEDAWRGGCDWERRKRGEGVAMKARGERGE